MATHELTYKNEKGLNVKVLTIDHVKPKKQLGRRECELNIFDLFHITICYNQKLLIYKGWSCDQFDHIVEKLKDGLGVVLEEFYQLAGNLWKDEDGIFKVVYDDDMRGVEVVAATAEGIKTADLMDEESFKELAPYNGVMDLEGLHRPLLAVQLTKLKDGLVMGCAFNHALLDGSATWHFMSSWAQICSGSTSISVQPFLDRTKAPNRRVKLDLTPPSETQQNGTMTTGEVVRRIDLRSRLFRFSELAIDRIKTKVNEKINTNPMEGKDSSKPFSSLQSFSAHVWRAVTRARQLNPKVNTIVAFAANCRKRVDPPMPENYFGNLVQGIFTMTKAGLLVENPPEFGAALIQKAIEMHDSEAVDKYNMEWERKPRIFENKKNLVNCVIFGSSPRFKVYEVDFGWGKPESVRSGSNYRFDGLVHLYQGKSGGKSIDMDISLEANAMKNLENDMEFLMEDNVMGNLEKDEELLMEANDMKNLEKGKEALMEANNTKNLEKDANMKNLEMEKEFLMVA